ncbi:Hypothetical predicted protein [Mytilus galloprovincialis]|uniref:Uncharacterized protein n=1 Tax=Mytilus galloprovincialis TaxID=29158 RepID=A0A8B6DYT6_MYTGA|nr:Hypothetical predicted protein [Mytilus galloprovincialis]
MQGLSDFIDDFRAKHESNVKEVSGIKNSDEQGGLREPENENTENMIRGFIKDELHIYHKLELGNVHRFGTGAQPGKRGRPRPIVARLIYHNDLAMKETIRCK